MSSIEASATTFTSSARLPTCSFASMRAVCPTKMRMPSCRNRPKPVQLDIQVVGADRHLRERVVAGLRGDGFVPGAVLGVLGDDARAWHDAAVRIDDRAGDGAAIALRKRAGGQCQTRLQSPRSRQDFSIRADLQWKPACPACRPALRV